MSGVKAISASNKGATTLTPTPGGALIFSEPELGKIDTIEDHSFNEQDATVSSTATRWHVQVEQDLSDCDSLVKVVVTVYGSKGKPVLFIGGINRIAPSFLKMVSELSSKGFTCITIDMPGIGRASDSPKLAARGNTDGTILSAIISAFSLQEVSVIAEGGGAGTFIRSYIKTPKLYMGHHMLLNPIISEIPEEFYTWIYRIGSDFKLFFADGFGPDDIPFSIGNCGTAFGFAERAQDRVDTITLMPPKGPNSITTGKMVAMRPTDYLQGISVADTSHKESTASSYFLFTPSELFYEEAVRFFSTPCHEPVREDGGPQAPTESLLAQGKSNSSFKVFVRVRPFLDREKNSENIIKVSDVDGLGMNPPPQRISLRGRSDFIFNRVFEPGTHEEICFCVVDPLVEAVVSGESNATLFAYGQTGSGKTYTMEGPAEGQGCLQHAINKLFSSGLEKVSFQYVQLYNSDFLDLLNPDLRGGGLKVIEGENYMYVQGATIGEANNADDLLKTLENGSSFRATGATNMNDASSRSHAILLLMVGDKVFYLVDLAGSERIKRSGVVGQGFVEATSINTALSALGRVVLGLVEKDGSRAGHIAYKDNPLTYLLKSGIGGNSKTALIACITSAEDSIDESMNTLRFATQASHVKNQADKKASKSQAKAAAAKIEDAGNQLVLTDKIGEIGPLSDGEMIKVRGTWNGPSELPVVLCLADCPSSTFAASDLEQFDSIASILEGEASILALGIVIEKEKQPNLYVKKVLECATWLGVAKPIIWGVDAGALVAIAAKIAKPSRVGGVILHNVKDNIDEKTYKKRLKKDPGVAMSHAYAGPWMLLFSMKKGEPPQMENLKKFKGGKSSLLLWPLQVKGKSSTQKSLLTGLRDQCTENLKGLVAENIHGLGDEEVAKLIRKVWSKGGLKAKKKS